MIKIFVIASLALASASILHAQVRLPDLYIYNYSITQTQRDPFISSDAPKTLMSDKEEPLGIISGDIVRQYLNRIIQLIKDELYVGGISIGDTPHESLALINGVDFHVGDRIPLDTTKKELQGIQQLAASYGLPLVTDEKGSFVLEVGRVTENGVDLVLPGFKVAIYQLPLPRDPAPTAIQLEKKKKKQTANN
jgi:hypothetical protein